MSFEYTTAVIERIEKVKKDCCSDGDYSPQKFSDAIAEEFCQGCDGASCKKCVISDF